MRRVCIESPLRAKNRKQWDENIKYAQRCLKDSLDRGEAPFASHLLYTQVLSDSIEEERRKGIALGLEWAHVALATRALP